MGGADLHIHSTASDGLLSPEEVVYWGLQKGLQAISLTDHDNINGIGRAVEYSNGKNIDFIPGIELSTDYKGIEVHMLGYYIDYKNPELRKFINELVDCRTSRAKRMVEKLNSMGFGISFEEIYETAGNASSIGRPHIARSLINLGFCNSVGEAFEKYLNKGRPAYVERFKLPSFKAVEIICQCGGAAVLAHPGLITGKDILSLVVELNDMGLDGIEVYHTSHTEGETRYFGNLAKRFNLIPTGGTDCHGHMHDNVPMIGSITVPYDNVIVLRERSYMSRGKC